MAVDRNLEKQQQFLEEVDRTGSHRTLRHMVCLHLHRPILGLFSCNKSRLVDGILLPDGGNILSRLVPCRKTTIVKILAIIQDKMSTLTLSLLRHVFADCYWRLVRDCVFDLILHFIDPCYFTAKTCVRC